MHVFVAATLQAPARVRVAVLPVVPTAEQPFYKFNDHRHNLLGPDRGGCAL